MYFENHQIHLPVLIYHFQHTNHDTSQASSFQNLPKLFSRVYNLNPFYLPHSGYCKLHFLQVMFHQVFPFIYIFICIKTFPQHQEKLTNASITKFVGACEWFCKIFIKPFLVVLSQFKLLMLKNHF